MDTALIIIIIAVALLVIAFAARRAWSRGQQARREKASELRVEATRRQERARQAEIEAEREREAAEARATRAERIDPDTEGGPGPLRRFRSGRDEDADEGERDHEEADEGERRRPSLWDRLVHR